MKKLDLNQKIGTIALLIFVVFLIVFSVLSSLVQYGALPDFTVNQRVQGVLVFAMFLPLFVSLFFWGKYFKSKDGYKIGTVLIFLSVALLIFGIVQMLLSLLGAFGS